MLYWVCLTGCLGTTGDNIIKVGIKGELWLSKEIGKTGVSEIVPIMLIAAEIIDKYANHPCRVNDGLLLPKQQCQIQWISQRACSNRWNQQKPKYAFSSARPCGHDA